MKKFVMNNTRYWKRERIERIHSHNTNRDKIDYILSVEDRIKDNITITYDLNGNKTNNNLLYVFDEAIKLRDSEMAKKRQFRKDGNDVVEMVVGLSWEQAQFYLDNGKTLEEGFEAYAKNLSKKYGFHILEIQVHYDEGYVAKSEDYESHNIHAHIVALNYDFNKNKTILRTLKQEDWEHFQDLAASSFQEVGLDFERGVGKLTKSKDNLSRNQIANLKEQERLNKKLERAKELEEKNESLTSSNNSLIEENETLRNKVKQAHLELLKVSKELKENYTNINTQKNELKDIAKTLNKQSEEYERINRMIKQLREQEQIERARSREIKQELQTLEIDLHDLDKLLSDSKIFLNQDYERYEKRIDSYLEKSKTMFGVDRDILKEHLLKEFDQNFGLRSENNKLKNEIFANSLKLDNVRALELSLKQEKEKIKELNIELNNSKNSTKHFEEELHKEQKRRESIQEELFELKEKLKKKNTIKF